MPKIRWTRWNILVPVTLRSLSGNKMTTFSLFRDKPKFGVNSFWTQRNPKSNYETQSRGLAHEKMKHCWFFHVGLMVSPLHPCRTVVFPILTKLANTTPANFLVGPVAQLDHPDQ